MPPLSDLFAPHERTLPVMLACQAQRYGNRPLVSAGRMTWSFAQARDETASFAGILREAGIKTATAWR